MIYERLRLWDTQHSLAKLFHVRLLLVFCHLACIGPRWRVVHHRLAEPILRYRINVPWPQPILFLNIFGLGGRISVFIQCFTHRSLVSLTFEAASSRLTSSSANDFFSPSMLGSLGAIFFIFSFNSFTSFSRLIGNWR